MSNPASKKSVKPAKRKRGRPITTGVGALIGMRWHEPLLTEIDEWRRLQPDIPQRTDAIRRLVQIGLAAEKGRKRYP